MKNAKKIALFALTAALLSISCDKEDTENVPELQDTRSTVQVGNWRVASLVDSGIDETGDFSGYTFTFDADGEITATDGSITQTGRWSVVNDDDDDDDDDQEDDLEFIISFPVPDSSIFDDLSDDWDIVSVTDTRIELIDRDDDDDAEDRLILARN